MNCAPISLLGGMALLSSESLPSLLTVSTALVYPKNGLARHKKRRFSARCACGVT
jgi:hypothetical protein